MRRELDCCGMEGDAGSKLAVGSGGRSPQGVGGDSACAVGPHRYNRGGQARRSHDQSLARDYLIRLRVPYVNFGDNLIDGDVAGAGDSISAIFSSNVHLPPTFIDKSCSTAVHNDIDFRGCGRQLAVASSSSGGLTQAQSVTAGLASIESVDRTLNRRLEAISLYSGTEERRGTELQGACSKYARAAVTASGAVLNSTLQRVASPAAIKVFVTTPMRRSLVITITPLPWCPSYRLLFCRKVMLNVQSSA